MRKVLSRAARTRAQKRGSALLEALIVSSALTLMLAVAVLFHGLYSARLLTLREARVEAWNKALGGCGGGLLTMLLNNMGQLTALQEADDAELIQAPDWLLDMGRGVADAAPESVRASSLLGGDIREFRAHRSVACNEYGSQKGGDSNIGAVFQAVRDMVLSR